jgi:transcription antitermination factor NusG
VLDPHFGSEHRVSWDEKIRRNESVEKSGWDSIGGAMSSVPLNWISDTATCLSSPMKAEERSWYAIQTRVRFEKKVVAQLESRGIEVFLPTIKQVHRWSDRRQIIEIPLFPGYAFVHVLLTLENRLCVLQTAGLIGLVAGGHRIVPVPEQQIEDVRRLLLQETPFAIYPFLRTGQRVRVRGGCLDGMEGVLAQQDSQETLVISISTIQRSLAIRVEGYEVEVV